VRLRPNRGLPRGLVFQRQPRMMPQNIWGIVLGQVGAGSPGSDGASPSCAGAHRLREKNPQAHQRIKSQQHYRSFEHRLEAYATLGSGQLSDLSEASRELSPCTLGDHAMGIVA
jgi:hypothetical protein